MMLLLLVLDVIVVAEVARVDVTDWSRSTVRRS